MAGVLAGTPPAFRYLGVPTLPDVTVSCEVISLADPAVSSNLGNVTISNDASLPLITQGTFLITWTYTDLVNCSVTQTQNIVIDDVTLPVATTQDITVPLGGTGNIVITPGQVDDGSSDDCGAVSLALDRGQFFMCRRWDKYFCHANGYRRCWQYY